MSDWYCYLIHSEHPNHKNKTYNGSTNDLKRRLRQHNGEITGGARRTSLARPWKYYAILTGFPDHKNTLSCEWKICHPTGHRKRPSRFNGRFGRISGLNEVLKTTQWTSVSEHQNKDLDLTLYILKDYAHLITNPPPNVTIHICDNIIDFYTQEKPKIILNLTKIKHI